MGWGESVKEGVAGRGGGDVVCGQAVESSLMLRVTSLCCLNLFPLSCRSASPLLWWAATPSWNLLGRESAAVCTLGEWWKVGH